MTIFNRQDEQYVREWAYGRTALDRPTGFGENLASAFETFNLTDRAGAQRDEMRRLYASRLDAVRELTGQEIDNPYLPMPSFMVPFTEGLDPEDGPERLIPSPWEAAFWLFNETQGGNEYQRIQAHEQQLDEIRNSLPLAQQALIPTLEDLQNELAHRAQTLEQENADLARRATFTGVLGQLAGSMGAATLQPEVLATLPVGAPARVGLLSRVLIESSIGAGTELVLQPDVQRQRSEFGLEAGFVQGLENVAIAGAGAGALTLGASGVAAILRGGSRAFRERFGRDPLPHEQAAIDLARQATDNERATPYTERTVAAAAAFDVNEQVSTLAAIEGRAVTTRELAQGSEELTRRTLQENGSLRVLTNADLDQIEVDADLMQFKAGGDEFGVTDRLQGVTEWNVERAGVGLVYEFADGRQIIADGHQRLGLARRLAAQGQDIELPVIMIREIDGITPQEARARAAYKNIAEGTGTAADAAKVLRDLGASVEDIGLPPRSALVRDAEGLVNVNDDVFGMVINDLLPDRFAAAIGRMIQDPRLQTNIAQLLRKLQPANVLEAEQIIDQARAAGVSRGTQSTLFGDEDIAESLYLERARVLDRAQKMLRRNATTFRTLLDQETEIAGAGNVLDQAANAERLEADRMIMQYVRAQANRRGPIADALTDAARAAKDSGSFQGPARDFLNALTRAIEQGEITRGAGRADRAALEFAEPDRAPQTDATQARVIPDDQTLAMFDEPVGRASEEQALAIDRELRDQIEAEAEGLAQPSIGQPVSLQRIPFAAAGEVQYRFKMDAPPRSVDELYAVAGKWQDELSRIGRTLGRRKGVTFKNPGLKDRATTIEKMARKQYEDTRKLTDIVRGGFAVETPAQADALVATLAQRYAVLDEGWNVTPAGYFDRKVLVKFEDGVIGEVQIWHPDMVRVKDARGTALYTQMRRLDNGSPEYQRLLEEQRALYSSVMDSFGDDWRSVIDEFVSGNGGRAGNVARNAEALRTRPESATSSMRAGTQSGAPSGMNQAAESSMTAGRPSQSTNVFDMLDTSNLDVELDPAAVNVLRGTSELEQMEIPIGERLDADGNRVAETATVRQVLDDLEADQEFLNQLDICNRSAARGVAA